MATRKATATATRQNAMKPTAPSRVTRATASRTPAIVTPPSPKRAPAEKTKTTTTRKPLVDRNTTVPPVAKKTTKAVKGKAVAKTDVSESDSREPIKAYLRIRPQNDDRNTSSVPYLKPLSATSVKMTDPSGSARIRMNPTSQVYTFNHVFPPETLQSEFFSSTTLPIVRDLISGQNGLVFTYGVTNSGKTYTIQGGSEPDTAGLLPRTLDVIFNSLEGLQSDAPYRPVRLASVEQISESEPLSSLPSLPDEKALADILGELSAQGTDSTVVKVDRNYEYAIWVSYAEVYNEKIFDLLSDADLDKETDTGHSDTPLNGLTRTTTFKKFPRSTSTWLTSLTAASSAEVFLVKRKALALKSDPEAGGKYIGGLRTVRVRTAEDAKRVFRTGNINRRVFGTLANAMSSRSHGIFTISVVRVHKADPSDITVSRLSIVDLAGSERSKNTHTTGERLKEAGNINKSLMVLGQCMEALRSNQRRLAASLAAPGRGTIGGSLDAQHAGNLKLAIVPFRHSKLTELFQDFFVGEREGRAVMIVNVNPCDTGFDENSHVMRFAALAKEVTTAPITTPLQAKVQTTNMPKTNAPIPRRRSVVIATGIKGRKASEAHLEVVEEDEENDDENDGPTDPLVDALFQENEELRIRLFDMEERCMTIENEIREEVAKEMAERMADIERRYAIRLMRAAEQHEMKTDAKIDMLQQFGAFSSNSQSAASSDDEFEEEASGEVFDINANDDDDTSTEGDVSGQYSSALSSPLQHKTAKARGSSAKPSVINNKPRKGSPECIGLRDEEMGIDELDADETMTIADGDGESSDEDEETEDGDYDVATSATGDDDEESWEPSTRSSPEPWEEEDDELLLSPTENIKSQGTSKRQKNSAAGRTTQSMTGLQSRMKEMSLYTDEDEEDVMLETHEAAPSRGKSGRGGKTSHLSSSGSTRRSTRSKR